MEIQYKGISGDDSGAYQLLIVMKNRFFLVIVILKLALPSSLLAQLAFEIQETPEAKIYNLQLDQQGESRTIWSRHVPIIKGEEPSEWCTLRAWAQNEHGLLAFVDNNFIMGQILQFNSRGDLVAEIETLAYMQRFNSGGGIKFQPPDTIQITDSSGKLTKLLIRDGRLADENGKISARQSTQIVIKRSSATTPPTPQPSTVPTALPNSSPPGSVTKVPEIKPTPTTPIEDLPSSTPWSLIVIVAVIVAAGGLLWLLFKGQRNR